MTSTDYLPGGGTEGDLEDGEIFDDDAPEEETSRKAPSLPSQNSLDSDSGGPKKHLSPNSFSPDRLRNSRGGRKSFEGRIDKRNERGGPAGLLLKKKKRGRDSDEEGIFPPRPKARRASDGKKSGSAGEEEVDENEMIYVMGGNSPTANNRNLMEWENKVSDEEVDMPPSIRGRRGGIGPRRAFEGARSMRRSRFTRGGKTRNPRLKSDRNEFTLCKFFMAGNCQRGKDCPFSHDASPPKRLELCKFYMHDRCNKKDKCLYMHQEFPCKFFHSGLKCYAGKRCKYSHGRITNYLRQALDKHLETCDLRDEHERMKEIFERKERNHFERYGRFPDRDDRRRSPSGEGDDESHTPMPSPQQNHFSDREGSLSPEGDPHYRARRNENRRNEDFPNDQMRNDSHFSRTRDGRRNMKCRKRRHDFDGQPEDDNYYKDFGPPNHPMDQSGFNRDDYTSDESKQDHGQGNYFKEDKLSDSQENSENFPANMPKIQRDLYMRIQQQLKKSESKTKEDDAKEDDFREENWYSSDEEEGGGSLTHPTPNIDLNLIFSNPGVKQNTENTDKEGPKTPSPPPKAYPDIDVAAVTKLLSTLRENMQKKQDEESKAKVNEPETAPNDKQNSSSILSNSPEDKRGLRDPRLRSAPGPLLLPSSDLDFRSSNSPIAVQKDSSSSQMDVDLRSLPFKPAPVHEAANEIDASVSSGPHIEWALKQLPPLNPDYKGLATRFSPQFCLNDPRLKNHVPPQALSQNPTPGLSSTIGGLLPTPVLMPGPGMPMPMPPMGHVPMGAMPMPGLPMGPGGPMPMPLPPMGPGNLVPGNVGPINTPMGPGGPMSIRDPRQRHSGDSKLPLINDPRRKAKPEIEDNDLRNMNPIYRGDTDFRVPSQPFYK